MCYATLKTELTDVITPASILGFAAPLLYPRIRNQSGLYIAGTNGSFGVIHRGEALRQRRPRHCVVERRESRNGESAKVGESNERKREKDCGVEKSKRERTVSSRISFAAQSLGRTAGLFALSPHHPPF